MKRIFWILTLGFAIGGCTRQAPPKTANKLPRSTPQAAPKTSARNAIQNSVRFAEFSADNALLVVGFWHGDYRSSIHKISGSLKIWNVRQRRKIGEIQFDAPVKTAVFLPRKNSLLVSAGKTYLCNLTVGHIAKKVVSAQSAEVMALSPDGKSVALSTRNDSVEIRSVSNWKVQDRIKMESPRAAFVRAMGFSPNGRRILIGMSDVDKGIELYNVATGRKVWTGDGDMESDVEWSSDGQRVAVNMRRDMYLFRARDGKVIKNFSSDSGSVWFSANNKQLFFTNKGTLVICDAMSGQIIRKIGISNSSSSVISRDAQVLALVPEDGSAVQFRALKLK